MDQITAHLDRGWDLVSKGDLERAAIAAEKALEIDHDSAEALNLMGFIHATRGEADEALECYHKAIEADESYFDAILNAAEILVSPLGDLEQALRLCEDALDLAADPDEEAECLLLMAEAFLYSGDTERARSTLARIDHERLEGAVLLFLYGKALYTLKRCEEAQPFFERALAKNPELADAAYFLGLARHEIDPKLWTGDLMLKTRALDLAQPLSPRAPSARDIQTAFDAAFRALPPRWRRVFEGSRVGVADYPDEAEVLAGVDPRSALHVVWYRLPRFRRVREITLFVRNLDRLCYSPQDLEDEIRFHLEDEARSNRSPVLRPAHP